jgi:prophage regulatory protein
MPESILRLPAVQSRTGLSRSSIYLKVSQGTFPRSVSLGSRSVGWFESQIEEWLANLTPSGGVTIQNGERPSEAELADAMATAGPVEDVSLAREARLLRPGRVARQQSAAVGLHKPKFARAW